MNPLAMHPLKSPVPTPPLPSYVQATAHIASPRPHNETDIFERPLPEPVHPTKKHRRRLRAAAVCGVFTAAAATLVGLGVAFAKQWREVLHMAGSK